jgi:MFS family permease
VNTSSTASEPSRDPREPARSAARDPSPSKAWYAVAILTIANISGFVDRQILSLLVEPIKRDLHVTDTQVSLLMGLGFVVFYSLLGLPIGRWVDRGHRPRIVALGAAVWSLMTAFTGMASSYAQLFAARIGIGVGEATLGPAAVSIIADRFPRRRLGLAMSTYMMGTFAGSGVAYALGAYVVGRFSGEGRMHVPLVGEVFPWQVAFFIIGLPGLLVAALALTMGEPRTAAPAASRSDVSQAASGDLLAYVKRNARTILALSLGFACSASVNYGMGAWLPAFFQRAHGWPVAKTGALMGVLTGVLGPIGVIAGGRLTDYWARKGHVDAPIRVGMLGAFGMLLLAGTFPLLGDATYAAALLLPVNVFAALPWGAANAAIAEAMPARLRGQGSAVYQLVVNLLSGALGPTAVALLTDHIFRDPDGVRWSISLNSVVGMTITLALLAWARPAYRTTVAAAAAE